MQEGDHVMAIGAMDDLKDERGLVIGWKGAGGEVRTLEGLKLK